MIAVAAYLNEDVSLLDDSQAGEAASAKSHATRAAGS
jgi:hypothetical protein